MLALKLAEKEVEEGGQGEYVGEEGDGIGGREAEGLVYHRCNNCSCKRGLDAVEEEEGEKRTSKENGTSEIPEK